MNQNRLMIRLIDVALLILLGFIAISRLKTEYVDLPAGGKNAPEMNRTQKATLHIYRNKFIFVDHGRKKSLKNLPDLEAALVNRKNRYERRHVKLVVNIEPQKSSIIQNLIDVLDICQRNQIEKNLDYDSFN
ncbi:MAG: ExbD/TolR family protein [bacterium]